MCVTRSAAASTFRAGRVFFFAGAFFFISSCPPARRARPAPPIAKCGPWAGGSDPYMPFAGVGGPGRATRASRGARGGGREGTQSNAGQKKPNKASERGPAQMGGLAQGARRPGPPCNAGAPSQHPPGGVGGRNWGAGPGSGRGRPRGRAAADFFFRGPRMAAAPMLPPPPRSLSRPHRGTSFAGSATAWTPPPPGRASRPAPPWPGKTG